MTSDFTVALQLSQREQLFVSVTDQTPRHAPKIVFIWIGWATFWAIFSTNSSGHPDGSRKKVSTGELPQIGLLSFRFATCHKKSIKSTLKEPRSRFNKTDLQL
jgi:hypothetical protein